MQNEIHSPAHLQDLIPTFTGIIISNTHQSAKVGIKSNYNTLECKPSHYMHLRNVIANPICYDRCTQVFLFMLKIEQLY